MTIMRKKAIVIIVSLIVCPHVVAQTTMRIHTRGGEHMDVPIERIDSMTFVEADSLSIAEAELTGSWLWGDSAAGYYELLTYNKDHTYTCYDNYFTYGFDTMTYGWYGQMGAMLTLQSNGYGYKRRYNWFMMGLSENALEVMTKMGPFTYYRLQAEVLTIQAGGTPIACEGGDSFIFADGVIADVQDNKLYGTTPGVTYIQKYIAKAEEIKAYKVVVE